MTAKDKKRLQQQKVYMTRRKDWSQYYCSCGGAATLIPIDTTRLFVCNGCRIVKGLIVEGELADYLLPQ